MSSPFALYPYKPGDRVTLKKTHPCGGITWTVFRAGMDIALRCDTCGHLHVFPRRTLEKSTRSVVSADTAETPQPKPPAGAPTRIPSGKPAGALQGKAAAKPQGKPAAKPVTRSSKSP